MDFRLIVSVWLIVFAQQAEAGILSGKVKTSDSSAPFARVSLLQLPDSSLKGTMTCQQDGLYQFNVESPGQFIVKAELQGFATVFSAPLNSGTESMEVPDLFLQRSKKSLDEVTVRSQKPLIEVKADKIVMNVDASIVSSGSTAFDVIQRAPGVSVDQNDVISLKGRQGIQIMIDGKLQPLGVTELAALLRAMPSGSIDKVEIISNPGARYDAAGTAGIINIKTKKDRRMGVNGTLTAGYGQGIYPKANAGLSLNKREKKLLMYGVYNYTYRKGINDLDLYRRFFEQGQPGLTYDQQNNMTIESQNHFVNLGADYDLKKNTTIGTMFSAGRSGFTLDGLSHANVLDPALQPHSSFQTIRNNSNDWGNWALNVSLRHNWDSSKSELGIDVDAARYNNSSDQQLYTQYQWPDGTEQQPDYLLRGDMSGYTRILAIKSDYSKSVNPDLKLEAGVKGSAVRADNNPVFYDCSNGTPVYDSGKSNHFIYDEGILAAYINMSQDIGKWALQAGLRVEQTIAQGHQLVNDDRFDRNYAQLFPNVILTRHVNPQHDVSISLSRRIDRPNYQQLNPFKRYLDVSSVNQGNPYLLPALTWTAELAHIWKSKFMTQLSWSRTQNVITQVIAPDANNTTIVTDQNLATNTVVSLNGTYPLQIKKWWSLVGSATLYYTFYEGYLAATALSAGSPVLFVNAQNSFTISPTWTAELTGWYQTGQRYGYMTINQQYVVNVGVQKSFWDRKASLRLNFTDLFLRQNPIGRTEFSNYAEDFTVMRDSRVATITATYRFGQKNAQPLRRRSRGAEEELRRASGGANG